MHRSSVLLPLPLRPMTCLAYRAAFMTEVTAAQVADFVRRLNTVSSCSAQ